MQVMLKYPIGKFDAPVFPDEKDVVEIEPHLNHDASKKTEGKA